LSPFMYALYSRNVTKASCWVCFLFSSVLMIANIFFRPSFPVIMQSPINCGAIAMLAGLVIVPVVSLFTPKPDKKPVDNAFACYEVRTEVARKTSL
ncbi:MAG: sodium:solute symporter, partial [Acetatifactor sp.]|nr:sodium:solute symporter [Acetatifactor sp.]